MRFALLSLAVLACEPSIPLPADATELDRIAIEELRGDQVPGMQAALIRDGEVEVHAWGWADTQTDRLVDSDTLFTIASISKLITTVAVMILVEEGALDLDAPVDVGFELQHPDITMRHLLTHTSGIVDTWAVMEANYTHDDPEIALADYLRGYLEPGGPYYREKNWDEFERFEYSNMGVALAGVVVERVTEQDFAEFCDTRIFEPLEMHDTSWFTSGIDLSRLAVPTQWRRGWDVEGHWSYPDYPNGTLRTSAGQLARFLVATTDRDAGFLAPETIDEMLRIQTLGDGSQALGFFWWRLNGEDVVGHDGGEAGIATDALMRPDHNDGVVVLTNGDFSSEGFRRVERALLESD